MLKRTAALLLAAFLLAACGGSTTPSIEMDGKPEVAKGDAIDGKAEVCTPECAGKKCGPNGCGGGCGTCEAWLQCDDAGQCSSAPCVSSIDCPGDLVCEETLGQCVVCVQDGDCDEGETCGPDHLCHGVVPCTSDKDCKDYGLLCDLDAGVCVQCLKSAHCAEDEYCQDSYCLPDVCAAGESHCEEGQVLACSDDGSGWVPAEACGEGQYCDEGACHDQNCAPGETFCDGDIAKECDEIGRGVVAEWDCTLEDAFCLEGMCSICACEPGAKFCVDDTTAGECNQDCLDWFASPCSAEHFCTIGVCAPWACEPDSVFCDGEAAWVCDSTGGSAQLEEDCSDTGLHCFEGACIATICVPGEFFCDDDFTKAECSQDGQDFTTEPCPDENYCDAGECFPWFCTPSSTFCTGEVAKVCDSKGSAVTNELDCSAAGQYCADGACIDCQPECEGKTCGPDGCGGECGQCEPGQVCINGVCPPPGMECDDGNDVDWDGCTYNQISEFRVNSYTNGDQGAAAVVTSISGTFVVLWSGEGLGDPEGIFAQCFGHDGMPHGFEKKINSTAAMTQSIPTGASLVDGRYVAAWRSDKQDGSDWGVFAQILDQEGNKVGEEFQVNSNTYGAQYTPAVASLPSGGFVIVWSSDGQDGSEHGAYGKIFDSDGAVTVDEFQLNVHTANYQTPRAVGALPGDEVLPVWNSWEQDGSGIGIFGRKFDKDGQALSGEFQINTFTAEWQVDPDLAVLGDTTSIVVWTSHANQDGNKQGVFAQRLDATGDKLGAEFQVNTYTYLNQSGPAISALSDGGAVIVWSSLEQDGDASGIFGQRYNAGADKVGDEFGVNVSVVGSQNYADVAPLAEGGFVVVWDSEGQDSSGWGIFAQRFDANGNKLYH